MTIYWKVVVKILSKWKSQEKMGKKKGLSCSAGKAEDSGDHWGCFQTAALRWNALRRAGLKVPHWPPRIISMASW